MVFLPGKLNRCLKICLVLYKMELGSWLRVVISKFFMHRKKEMLHCLVVAGYLHPLPLISHLGEDQTPQIPKMPSRRQPGA